MAKRFTDTFKWQRPWFRNLPPPYRELWLYILDMCDHVGIWYVDFQMAELILNCKIEKDQAEQLFNKQMYKIDNSRWFIKDFINFQYGKLTNSRFHDSIRHTLKSFRIPKIYTLSVGYREVDGTPKVKDKVIISVKGVTEGDVGETKRLEWFNRIWLAYPKERRHGKEVSFTRFAKSVPDLDTAKRCARALENYVEKLTDKKYLMRASRWFAEWEDHADDKPRDSQGISGENADPAGNQSSPGERKHVAATDHVLRTLADSKAFGKDTPADNT